MTLISDADRHVILARYQGYKNDFRGALATLDRGLERFPDYGPLHRHRAHRLITFREFDDSIAASEKAIELCADWPDEIEYYQKEFVEDAEHLFLGQPDRMRPQRLKVTPEVVSDLKGIYKSTLHSSIWYHYGLAFYLKGDYARAVQEYRTALEKGIDDDMRVAASDWVYMGLKRSGADDDATEFLDSLPDDLEVNERSYWRRILMYKGKLDPEELLAAAAGDAKTLVTQGYGLGNWYLCNGQTDKAVDVFERIVAVGVTNAFGHIAAEIDLAALKGENNV